MKIVLNKERLRDKIYACWIGKNIGGTLGGPYEGSVNMNDITGFITPKGEPLPNDDLDLQMVWLITLERVGAMKLDANDLGNSWMMMIAPLWNEYGIAKKNLDMGILPPLCGEYDNQLWRNSNGAWIRSEVWACLAPGFPNIAAKYAIMDASVDHGLGEGTYASIFTAAMESIAFAESDIRKIVEQALAYLPASCRVAQCARCVLEEYDKGTDYRTTREKIVELTKDLGFFQAPNNVGFAVLGLIYGEGDFKKSLIYTVNCGDDTDCTGGTVGAVLGIIKGTAGIPVDWREYIGDRIVQMCINASYLDQVPKTCMEFTERILVRIPELLQVHKVEMEYTDGEECYDKVAAMGILKDYAANYYKRSPYSFDINIPGYLFTRVEFEKEPVAQTSVEIPFMIKFKQPSFASPIQGNVNVFLPEGWTAKYRKTVHIARTRDIMEVSMPYEDFDVYSELGVVVVPGEQIEPVNKVYVMIELSNNCVPLMIPVVLPG